MQKSKKDLLRNLTTSFISFKDFVDDIIRHYK